MKVTRVRAKRSKTPETSLRRTWRSIRAATADRTHAGAPSPRAASARTVEATATTGVTVVQLVVFHSKATAWRMSPRLSSVPQLVESMFPQLAGGSRIPMPRKEMAASRTTIVAKVSVE
jgi:hypothetical protein